MTGRRVYLLGLALVSAAGSAIVATLPLPARTPSLISLLVGLVLQGPLGWWLVRSVGTPRFIVVWVTGIGARFAVLGVMALLVFPALHWPVSPGLLVLGGVLVALLFLEGLVVWLNVSGRSQNAPTSRVPTEAR